MKRFALCAAFLASITFVVVAQETNPASSPRHDETLGHLIGSSQKAKDRELHEFSKALGKVRAAKLPRTWHEIQELKDKATEALESAEALKPSKLEQWEARDDLIELVFDVDEETAHYLYSVVRAALERRDAARQRHNELRSRIEALVAGANGR